MKEKSTFYMGRRSFLKHLSIGSLAFSPFIHAQRAAAATPVKPRLLVIVLSHGPGGPGMAYGTETNFTVSPWLSPLQSISKHLILVDGLQGTWWGNAHDVSYSHLLTSSVKPDTPSFSAPRSASLDVILEKALGKSTLPVMRLRSDVWGGSGSLAKTFCYNENLQPIAFQSASQANASLLANIGGVTSSEAKARALAKKRKRILDEVSDELKSLRLRIDGQERLKLDQFVEGISDTTAQLGLGGQATVGGNCVAPDKILSSRDLNALNGTTRYERYLDYQFTHVKTAFACNLAQIAVMDVAEVPHDIYEWTDVNGQKQTGKPCADSDFHQCVAHYDDRNRRLCFEGSVRWQMQKITDFAKQMDAIKESNGKSLLENTVIVVTGEVGNGDHNVKRKPHIIIGGSGAPKLRTGRYLAIPEVRTLIQQTTDGELKFDRKFISSRTEGDLWREVCAAMGHSMKTFGVDYLNRGAIGIM
ncbi:MAG: DUF1552 domain-containing protein [Myxococcales bacterium]|nr:DUF1552 domain-containing protein [Myxococcales bacterium]MCB9641946.1 DUF1552 domain-containing protein [Myxococcales bacterium]